MSIVLHQSNAPSVPSEFRNDDFLTDVVFVVKDARVACHRLVLAASSDLLCRFFSNHPDPKEILLPDFSEQDLIHLLDLVYNGELICNRSNLPDISELLNLLEISYTNISTIPVCIENETSNIEEYYDVLDDTLLPRHRTSFAVGNTDPKLLSGCKVSIHNDPSITDMIMKQLKETNNISYPENGVSSDMGDDNASVDDIGECDLSSSDDEWKAKCEEESEAELSLTTKRKSVKIKGKRPNLKQRRRSIKNKFLKQKQSEREKCRYCDLFITKQYMPGHEARMHGIQKESRFACDKCEEKFSFASELQKHSTIHTYGRVMYPCKKCGKAFETMRKRDSHTHVVHSRVVCRYCCKPLSCAAEKHYDICSERRRIMKITGSSSKQNGFDQNMDSDTPKSKDVRNGIFKCKECGIKMKALFGLRRHERNMHGILAFSCSKCDSRFDTHRELRLHLVAHNPNQLPHKCKYCDQYFESQNMLWSHYRNHHMDVLTHFCSKCKKHIPKAEYASHSNSHKVFQCDTCGKACESASGLQFHQLTHKDSSEWEFSCEQCPKMFKRKDALHLHHMVMHTDPALLPHKCSHCSAGFAHKSRLAVHMKRHLRPTK